MNRESKNHVTRQIVSLAHSLRSFEFTEGAERGTGFIDLIVRLRQSDQTSSPAGEEILLAPDGWEPFGRLRIPVN